MPYIHKAEVQDFITNGVHLRTPSPRPPLHEAATGDEEVDFFTCIDILDGVAKGTILGGFDFRGQDSVTVIAPDGRSVVVDLNGVKLFRVNKAKNRNPNGRGITDFKQNLLNDMYSRIEKSVFLPSLQDVTSVAKDVVFAFLADFTSAYKQIALSYYSWGAVTYLLFGKFFIELAMTFGWAPACRIFQHFSESFLVALAHHFPYLFQDKDGGPVKMPSPFTEVKGVLGLMTAFIDDYFVGAKGTREMAYQKSCAQRDLFAFWFYVFDMGASIERSSQVKVYLGRVFDLVEKTTYLPPAKLKRVLDRINCFLSGKRYGFGLKQFGPRLYNGRDLAGLAGSLNYLALLEKRLYPLIAPVYRACDNVGLTDLIRISFTTHK